jgi:hypothetical protein
MKNNLYHLKSVPTVLRMRKTVIALASLAMIMTSSCSVELPSRSGVSNPVASDLSQQNTGYWQHYAGGCFEDPHHYTPEWCDWFDDGSTCCVWYVENWFEEYCQWGTDICWDYNGSF